MPVITAAHLYDHVACPHRVHLDNFGQMDRRDEISPFVRLLWEQGSTDKASVVAALPNDPWRIPHDSKRLKSPLTRNHF